MRTSEIQTQEALKTLESCPRPPHLIFMDPPFNVGVNYGWGINDSIDEESYIGFLRNRIFIARAVLHRNGSLWIHLPDRWAANAVVYARDILGMTLENWIIWHYRFGQCRTERFISSKCHGLWFSKGAPTVYPLTALVPSDRAAFYNDARSTGLRMDLDVWGFDKFWGRVQGNNKERREGHPNQLPEKYLERIIKLTTVEGDLVVDPFTGSGTTPVVASALHRDFYGGDISTKFVASALQRVKDGAIRVEQEQ